MRDHDDLFPGGNDRRNALVPAGKNAEKGVFQAFGGGEFIRPKPLTAGGAGTEGWRPNVVTASPEFDLFLAELEGCLGFVESLQGAIVPFIQPPVSLDGNPHAIHFVEDEPPETECPGQHRGNAASN